MQSFKEINYEELMEKQKALDDFIIKEKNLVQLNDKVTFLSNTLMAFTVELGELANELRFFKLWSNKGPSEKSVIVEEAIDCLHFLLSLSYQAELNNNDIRWAIWEDVEETSNPDKLRSVFLTLYEQIGYLTRAEMQGLNWYIATTIGYVWKPFSILLGYLGITPDELLEAYEKKMAINYARQEGGY